MRVLFYFVKPVLLSWLCGLNFDRNLVWVLWEGLAPERTEHEDGLLYLWEA